MLPPKLVREVGKANALKRASKEQQEKQQKTERERERREGKGRELRACQRGVAIEGAAIKIKRKTGMKMQVACHKLSTHCRVANLS